jgi:hypothetical protein
MGLLHQKTYQKNILPLFLLVTFSLNVFTLILLFFHGSMLKTLRNLSPTLVQLLDGRVITVNAQQDLERHPETIRRFVGETFSLMFTWSEKQPPLTVWQTTSQLLSGDVKNKFEQEFRQGIPNRNFDNAIGDTESVLVIQQISQPEEISPGKWQLQVTGHRLLFTKYDMNGGDILFNKKILVRALDTAVFPPNNVSTPLDLAVSRLGEARLEIYNVCDVKDNNCL